MDRIAQFQEHRYAIECLTGKPKLYTTNYANNNESFITKKIFFFIKMYGGLKGAIHTVCPREKCSIAFWR